MNYQRKLLCYAVAVLLLMLIQNCWAGQLQLEDGWRFRIDSANKGISQRWYLPGQSNDWKPIRVGKNWEQQGYPYDGYAWYTVSFELPKKARGGQVTINFGAVDEEAKIWLNGRFVKSVAVGWNSPFELDVTDRVRYNSSNHLAVQVLDNSLQGGIWKPVSVTYEDGVEKTKPAFVQRLEKEGVRSLSSYVGNDSTAKKQADAGINMCIPWAYLLQKSMPPRKVGKGEDFIAESDINIKSLNRLRVDGKMAKKHGLIYLPNIWFHKDTLVFLTKNDGEFRKFVSVYGKRSKISPCPVDDAMWERLWLPQMKIVANIQKEVGYEGGICLDLEYYVGDFSGGYCYDKIAVQGCYCDYCFGLFLSLRGDERQLKEFSLPQRAEYIKRQYSLPAYLEFLELEVAKKVRSVCQEVRKIKPDIIMGMLPGVSGYHFQGVENWFTRGAVRGMSTPQLPAIALSEVEYRTGFNSKTSSQLEWAVKEEVPVLIVGGLMIGRFSAQGIGAKAAEMARRANGYWLYHGASLNSSSTKIIPTDKSKQYAHSLREPAANYWKAIKTANDWLDSGQALYDGKRQTSVPIFTAESIKNKSEIKVTNAGIEIEPSLKAVSLIKNGKFNKPFDSGWKTFDQKPAIAKMRSNKGQTLLYDFKQRPDDQGKSSFFQTIELAANNKYRVKADVKIESLAGDRTVGLYVYKYNSSRTLLRETTNQADMDWTTLQGDFSAGKQSKVNLVLLANGNAGKVWFDNIRIYNIGHIRLETNNLVLPAGSAPLRLALPEPPEGADFEWELLNPETGLGYFEHVSSQTDIRYLTTIYPDAPLALALEADFEQSADSMHIDSGKIIYIYRKILSSPNNTK